MHLLFFFCIVYIFYILVLAPAIVYLLSQGDRAIEVLKQSVVSQVRSYLLEVCKIPLILQAC